MTAPEKADQHRVVLPPGLMEVIKSITSDDLVPPADRLTGVLVLVWGWAWYEEQATVDPRMIALSEAQWQQICGMLASGVTTDRITGVNLGLSWMNQGPSAYAD